MYTHSRGALLPGQCALTSVVRKPPSDARRWNPYERGRLPVWLTTREGATDFSDIPVFDASALPDELWREDWAQRPFIVRECPELMGRREALQKGRLIDASELFGLNTSVGQSWSIPLAGGEGPTRVPLAQFLRKQMDAVELDGDDWVEPPYAFDRRTAAWGQALDIPGAVPEFIRAWNETAFGLGISAGRIAMLGGPGSAVGWHRHGAAVQMTVHGWKRWLLYPAGQYPPGDGPGGGYSTSEWLRLVYPELPEDRKPIECIQRPGDMIYVPSDWYHAVVNLADSVAISVQNLHCPAEQQEALKGWTFNRVRRLEETDPHVFRHLMDLAWEHMERHPANDLHARRVLFYGLSGSRKRDAYRLMLAGTDKDPFHATMQFELAHWLEGRASAGDGEAIDDFREAMRRWRPYLERNTRNQKAQWILSRYSKLVGDTARHEKFHARLVDLHQRGIDR